MKISALSAQNRQWSKGEADGKFFSQIFAKLKNIPTFVIEKR
jgi:hypothetical protein